jgi:hypothetical protein
MVKTNENVKQIFFLITIFVLWVQVFHFSEGTESPDYTFDGTISRQVLENYLARSATVASLLHLTLDDDLRMVKNTGCKFAGRVIWMWGGESRIEVLIEKGKPFAARLHEMDPELILQGAVFEIVSEQVNELPIPGFVFDEFGMEPEKRTFQYEAMLYDNGHRVDFWNEGASVPDMSKLETRMWFYYVSRRYIDIGVEALHFGQVGIMDDADPGHKHWLEMLGRVRRYAKKNARRHMVICDAHVPSGGIVHDGKLMFDLHSFPSRPKCVADEPYKAILKKGFSDSIYGRSAGGVTPSGWACESLPYIVEIDNFGTSDHPGECRETDRFHVWGWDEITWFANQPEAYRNEWLLYAYNWVRETDPAGYFQLPLRRFEHYSASMITGKRQESTIKAIWEGDDDE